MTIRQEAFRYHGGIVEQCDTRGVRRWRRGGVCAVGRVDTDALVLRVCKTWVCLFLYAQKKEEGSGAFGRKHYAFIYTCLIAMYRGSGQRLGVIA
jgi:hypothetical protein